MDKCLESVRDMNCGSRYRILSTDGYDVYLATVETTQVDITCFGDEKPRYLIGYTAVEGRVVTSGILLILEDSRAPA